MNIIVLNGSPKGEISVTMQYIAYLARKFPEHTFTIHHIAQRIKRLESNAGAFDEVIEAISQADGVLWAFPVYYMLVHAGYKRFIELVFERDAGRAFAGKHAAAFSTSIHFFDHTAHEYIHAICDDLGMRYVGGYPAAMRDLLEESQRRQIEHFARLFLGAIADGQPCQPRYAPSPVVPPAFQAGAPATRVATQDLRISIIHDTPAMSGSLGQMVSHLRASFDGPVSVFNLREIDFKGHCQGCLECASDNHCVYEEKDGYIPFFREAVMQADIVFFAGTITDRYLSARWKQFFDRSFFVNHVPSLSGKQLGFVISGPLGANPTLHTILEAYAEMQQANLPGIVCDEAGDGPTVARLLESLAARSVEMTQLGYQRAQSFQGVGGHKIFRDEVWGHLRPVFAADNQHYRQNGGYDFPQRDIQTRLANLVLAPLLRVPVIRAEFNRHIKQGMISRLKEVAENAL